MGCWGIGVLECWSVELAGWGSGATANRSSGLYSRACALLGLGRSNLAPARRLMICGAAGSGDHLSRQREPTLLAHSLRLEAGKTPRTVGVMAALLMRMDPAYATLRRRVAAVRPR
jgi:hypothetical protein